MSINYNNLKMLPVNKTVVFKSPLERDEDVLCRTGTIAEGSCFFHSLLQAICKEYQTMNTENKLKFVERLRKKISSNFSEKDWEKISGGMLSKISYQEEVYKNFNDIYYYFNKDKIKHSKTKELLKKILKKHSKEDYKLITELIPLKVIENNILPVSYQSGENEVIEECNEIIVKNTVEYVYSRPEFKNIPDSKSDYIINVIISMFLEILQFSKSIAYKEYIKNMKNCNEDVDSFILSTLSDTFNRDIYFIDGETRMPYNNASTAENLKGRKSVIILWVSRNHYEIVGRLLPNNIVQREFKHDDPLIEKMYTFLIHPEKICDNYPELETFIPKDYRMKRSPNPYDYTFNSDSEVEKTNSSETDSEESEESEDSYTGYHRSVSRRESRKRK